MKLSHFPAQEGIWRSKYGDDASRAGAEDVSSRILRGETDIIVLHRSDYRSVEDMVGQLRDLLESLSDDVNYSLKIQVVKAVDL